VCEAYWAYSLSLVCSISGCCCRLPPGQEIEPRQISPHLVDKIGAKCLLLTQRVDAIEKIVTHHGDNAAVLEKLHKLCLSLDQDGMKVCQTSPFPWGKEGCFCVCRLQSICLSLCVCVCVCVRGCAYVSNHTYVGFCFLILESLEGHEQALADMKQGSFVCGCMGVCLFDASFKSITNCLCVPHRWIYV